MTSVNPARPILYVCDPSAEAAKLESTLKQAGYEVVDVPRQRLVDRVRLERPAAIVLDVADEAALAVVPQIRATPGGEGVHVLFVTARGGPLRDAEDALMRDGSGLFLRPIDPTSVLRKVEALVGPGDTSRERTPSRSRHPVQPAPADFPSGRSLESTGVVPTASLARDHALPDLADDIRALLAAADARAAAIDLSGAAPPLDGDSEIDLVLGPEDLAGIAPTDDVGLSESDQERSVTSGATAGRAKSDDERALTENPVQTARRTTAPRRTSTTPGYFRTPVPAARAPANDSGAPLTRDPSLAPGSEPVVRSLRDLAADDGPARAMRDAALAMPRRPRVSVRPPADVPPPSIMSPPQTSTPEGISAARVESPGESVPTGAFPSVLAEGMAAGLIAGLVRARTSGVLTVSEGSASRALTLRDGDISSIQSTHPEDAILPLLERRGLLARGTARSPGLSGVPRLACAALVARGLLAQDDLWPALRLHAEQLLTALLGTTRGTVTFVEGRAGEDGPTPFGALSGSAVFVRCFCLARGVATFGERAARRPFVLIPGPRFADRAEALGGDEAAREIEPFLETTLDGRGSDAFAAALTTLEALAHLGIVSPVERIGTGGESEAPAPPVDSAALDADALRRRIVARRKLVDEGDYFTVLGVQPQANAFEVRQAYLELRRGFEPARILRHPELVAFEGDLRVILEVIEEAFNVLRDDTRRDRYRRAIGAAAG